MIRDVKDQLFWSPYVNESEINVAARNRKVELSGTVETWREKQLAEKNAYQAGANDVSNNIETHYAP